MTHKMNGKSIAEDGSERLSPGHVNPTQTKNSARLAVSLDNWSWLESCRIGASRRRIDIYIYTDVSHMFSKHISISNVDIHIHMYIYVYKDKYIYQVEKEGSSGSLNSEVACHVYPWNLPNSSGPSAENSGP